MFAPSKFLGYKGATLENYKHLIIDNHDLETSRCDGRDTEPVLKKYFYEIDKGTEEFNKYYGELKKFADNIHRTLNTIVKDGSGGIHVPKDA
jgi:hypothetical protein